MSAVVGIDLSSRALDLVKLDETSNAAEWVRVELAGANAWERTLNIRAAMPPADEQHIFPASGHFWDDVYLVAIEAPYGRGQAGTSAILNRVVGAVAASLPAALRAPERCWIVRPDEYRNGLGLKAKPTDVDIRRISGGEHDGWSIPDQDARDAYCLAYWAREQNAKGVAAA